MDNGKAAGTTDSWSWGKILKHVLLPKPKGSPKAGKKEFSVRIAMAAIFGLIAFQLFAGGKSLPTCNQAETQQLVGGIVNNMPLVKQLNANFVALKGIEEQGHNKNLDVRACYATLVTTVGEDDFQYSIKWSNKTEGTFEVKGQIVN